MEKEPWRESPEYLGFRDQFLAGDLSCNYAFSDWLKERGADEEAELVLKLRPVQRGPRQVLCVDACAESGLIWLPNMIPAPTGGEPPFLWLSRIGAVPLAWLPKPAAIACKIDWSTVVRTGVTVERVPIPGLGPEASIRELLLVPALDWAAVELESKLHCWWLTFKKLGTSIYHEAGLARVEF